MSEVPDWIIAELMPFATGERSWNEWGTWFAETASKLAHEMPKEWFKRIKSNPPVEVIQFIKSVGVTLFPNAMLSRETAESLVLEYAHDSYSTAEEIIINEPYVRENELAWVFPYNTRKFLEHNDIRHCLMANSPVLVCKQTGKLHIYPSDYDSEKVLDSFAAGRLPFED